MIPRKAFLTRLALDILYFSGIYHLFKPAWSGVGLIFTLHHVGGEKTDPTAEFSPNRILTITPDFLESTILQLKRSGYDFVDLTEARRRLVDQDFAQPFVCFTMDDGYHDNYAEALPVFRRHGVPFTVYVSTGLIDRTAVLWWEHLEEVVRDNRHISISLSGRQFDYPTSTVAEKYQAFNAIYWYMRQLDFTEQQQAISELLQAFEINPAKLCDKCGMTWDTLQSLAADQLVTIGGHTVSHPALSKLAADEVRAEVIEGRRLLAEKLATDPAEHFAYPFGDSGSAAAREFEILGSLDFATATTTRKGVLFPQHKDHLQALPRVSLNGDYQKNRYVKLFLSGAPFALFSRFRRLNVA